LKSETRHLQRGLWVVALHWPILCHKLALPILSFAFLQSQGLEKFSCAVIGVLEQMRLQMSPLELLTLVPLRRLPPQLLRP
jgi:hypothetical protein